MAGWWLHPKIKDQKPLGSATIVSIQWTCLAGWTGWASLHPRPGLAHMAQQWDCRCSNRTPGAERTCLERGSKNIFAFEKKNTPSWLVLRALAGVGEKLGLIFFFFFFFWNEVPPLQIKERTRISSKEYFYKVTRGFNNQVVKIYECTLWLLSKFLLFLLLIYLYLYIWNDIHYFLMTSLYSL